MQGRQALRMKVFAAIVLLVLLVVLAARYPLFVYQHGTTIGGWLLFLLTVTYNASGAFYLFVQQLRFWVGNHAARWDLSVDYQTDLTRSGLRKLVDQLEASYRDKGVRREDWSNTRFRITVNTVKTQALPFELSLAEEDSGPNRLHVSGFEIWAPFRESDRLEREIMAILEAIEDAIRPTARDYGLTIYFDGKNPYYGFFLRRLAASAIQSFHVDLTVKAGLVTVSKERLAITTRSKDSFRDLVAHYLALSPMAEG